MDKMEQFLSAEEVAAAAKMEFQVDLNDGGAVMVKAQELNRAAQKTHDYSPVERLTALFDTYNKMSGTEQKKAA